MAAWFKVPTSVVVNKADICPEVTERIRAVCRERTIEVIGTIPFDRKVPEDLAGGTIPIFGKGPGAAALRQVGRAILARLEGLIQNKTVDKVTAPNTTRSEP